MTTGESEQKGSMVVKLSLNEVFLNILALKHFIEANLTPSHKYYSDYAEMLIFWEKQINDYKKREKEILQTL